MGKAYSMYVEEGECIWVLMRELAGKRPLGRPKLIWEYDIKMDLQ